MNLGLIPVGGWTFEIFVLRLLIALSVAWLLSSAVAMLCRHGSAALRHRIWSLSVAAALALPALIALLPQWQIAAIPAPSRATEVAVHSPSAPQESQVQIATTDAPAHIDNVTPPVKVPELNVPVISTATPIAASSSEQPALARAGTSGTAKIPVRIWLLTIWLAVAVWLLVRQLAASLAMHTMVRRGRMLRDGTPVQELDRIAASFRVSAPPLYLSHDIHLPLCVGCIRPSILLPLGCENWDHDQLRASLTHELAHVVRRDVLWQTLGRVATAIYWFHPLAWLASWRMRVERELACDDWVLRAGQSSARYAGWLVNMAASLSGCSPTFDRAAVAMAARNGLERRILAILKPQRRRSPLSRLAKLGLALVTVLLLLPLSVLNPLASPARAGGPQAPPTTRPASSAQTGKTVSGIVVDEKNRPAASVTVSVHNGLFNASMRTGANGKFLFDVTAPRLFPTLFASTDDGLHQAFANPRYSDGLAPMTSLRLVLQQVRQFQVTVADESGRPVEGAALGTYADFTALSRATTDSAGKAALTAPVNAPLMYLLAAKPNVGFDYTLFWREDQPKTDPYRLDANYAGPLHFVLNGATRVRVHVFDEQHRPLRNVTVNPWLLLKPRKGEYANMPPEEQFTRTTDADGIAEFNFIPRDQERPINFWTRLEGYSAPKRCLWDPKSGRPDIDTVLQRMVDVSGQVVNASGQPVEGATILVNGRNFEADGFNGEARSGRDGGFTLAVNPDTFYMFVAQTDKNASTPITQLVRTAKIPKPVQLVMQPGTRVFGRVAVEGESPDPSARINFILHDDRSYYKLSKEEQLPGGVIGRFSISPSVNFLAHVDKKGNFESYLPPGKYSAMAFSTNSRGTNQQFEITEQKELELKLTAESKSALSRILKGRVVRADKPEIGVPEATISASTLVFENMRIGEGVSDRQGNFSVTRGKYDFYLFAVAADGLRGTTLVKSTDNSAIIKVAPTASVRARLIDPDGRPIPNRPIRYGVRVDQQTQAGKPARTFTWAFGGEASTDDEGFFLATGLITGSEYEINPVRSYNPDGQPMGWFTVRKLKADRPERMDLGDLTLPNPPKPKTAADYTAEAFHPIATFDQRLERARHVAKVCYQRILVLLAPAKDRMAETFFDYRFEIEHPEGWRALANYMLLTLDTNTADAAAHKWAQVAGIDWPTAGMTLAVLDPDGHLITQTSASALSVEGTLNRKLLIDFADRYAPALPDAQKLLDDAFARAAREHKNVMLDESSPYCGWCVKLTDYLDANHPLLDNAFVRVTLDRRFAHGKEILTKLRTAAPEDHSSTPWTVILSPDGRTLITSDGPKGNIGYPGEEGGRTQWEKILRTGGPRFTDSEIRSLLAAVN